MIARALGVLAVALLWFAGTLQLGLIAERAFPSPYPPLSQATLGRYAVLDAALLGMGQRRSASNLAWIQLLQVCTEAVHHHDHGQRTADLVRVSGPRARDAHQSPPHPSPADPTEPHNEQRPAATSPTGKENCDQFKEMAWRVVRLDPYFRRAYLYASTFLAYEEEVKDPAEAVRLLTTGVRYDPEYLFYKTYLGIIAYMEAGDLEPMVALLEEALRSPDSPVIAHILLARIYVQMGRNARALEILYALLENPDAGFYWERARKQIEAIAAEAQR